MTAQTPTEAASPRVSALDRGVAMRLAEEEYERFTELLAGLTAAQWAAPTECPGWDVRAMAGHVLGMTQMAASLPETVRQQLGSQRRAKRDRVSLLDALTALQVDKNARPEPSPSWWTRCGAPDRRPPGPDVGHTRVRPGTPLPGPRTSGTARRRGPWATSST